MILNLKKKKKKKSFLYGTSLSKNKSSIYSLTKSQSNTNHKLTRWNKSILTT